MMPLAEPDRVHPEPDHVAVVEQHPAVDPHVVHPRAVAGLVVLEGEAAVGLADDPGVDLLDLGSRRGP